MTEEASVWDKIVALAADLPTVGPGRVGRKREFTRQTNLVDDLGLVGDDALEFMERYASTLNLRKGDYDSSAYFDPEGLWLLPRFGKKKEKLPLTLGMLELAAKEGEWNSVRLNQARLNNAYE